MDKRTGKRQINERVTSTETAYLQMVTLNGMVIVLI